MEPRGGANIGRSGGWIPRYEYRQYSQRMGETATPTKILRPKSNTLEVLLRAKDEREDQSIQICEPYERATGLSPTPYTQQILKNTFQKPLELALDDEMHTSSVIGWASTEHGKTILINRTFLGISDEDTVPLTDTIFPVLVMGIHEMPVLNYCFDRDFPGYEPGFYLVLRNRPMVKSLTVEIEVIEGSTPRKVRVQTNRAVLQLYNFHILWNQSEQNYHKYYKNMGNMHRIVDKEDTTYGVYGMYGGGPLPTPEPKSAGRPRITWDQPRNYQEFGLSSMESGFRCGIDYQQHSQRTGFYCSKDALLAVSERSLVMQRDPNDERNYYKSLLKEYTFVINDGFSYYAMFHNEGNTQWVQIENPNQPLGSLIVIVPEGLSSLRMAVNKDNLLHRNSEYYNQNSTQPPIIINWRAFQKNFSRSERTDEDIGDRQLWNLLQPSAQPSQ